MKTFVRVLRMPPADRRLLGEAALAVSLIRVALWTVSFGRLRGWLERLGDARRPLFTEDRSVATERIVWAVRAASGRVPGATCLTQALAARLLLGRRGLPSELRIGVARSPSNDVEAHAWLECRGEVVIGEPEPGRYGVLGTT
jgi:hypothetical protein